MLGVEMEAGRSRRWERGRARMSVSGIKEAQRKEVGLTCTTVATVVLIVGACAGGLGDRRDGERDCSSGSAAYSPGWR